jgi:hypothetical protein
MPDKSHRDDLEWQTARADYIAGDFVSRIRAALPTLPPKRPQDTQTAWEDPWAATQAALQEMADMEAVGHRISEEISADPAEAARLRMARRNARAGKTAWRMREIERRYEEES